MTTAQSILDGLQRAMLLRAESKFARQPMPRAVDATGTPVFRTVRETLWQFAEEGDIIRIYRGAPLSGRYWHSKYGGGDLRAIRAEKGVGRPPLPIFDMMWDDGSPVVWDAAPAAGPLRTAIAKHGSQRAAARALGLNLSTFQRRLAKEAA